jgi:redox-sensitive bicupin YhaK (pirin superfamily)
MGSVDLAPGEAKGTPWHPHRGFETVTYMIDGALEHKDSTGGGGLITNGGTQWMTAGAGILHIEQPDEQLVMKGGVMHGVQLWVNLPASAKMTAAKYQDINPGDVKVVTNLNGDAIIRIIAGNLGEHEGPGMTFTPITYAHITLMPGARVVLPWRTDFSAMVYALNGRGSVGADNAPLAEAELAILDEGDTIAITAAEKQDSRAGNFDVLVLGGLPIREPISHYGPFVMNTREQIIEAMEDFQKGRMGQIPATHV